MKPKLKPPGTKHLKLKCHKLLSILPSKFNLRRYTLGRVELLEAGEALLRIFTGVIYCRLGSCPFS